MGSSHTIFTTAPINHIDLLLSPGDDLETLLKRQEGYRNFQNSYFTGQQRTPTGDGLGYVSHFVKDDVQMAILGLDSAWLAEGGIEDHGKLLIGERQMINAIALAGESTWSLSRIDLLPI